MLTEMIIIASVSSGIKKAREEKIPFYKVIPFIISEFFIMVLIMITVVISLANKNIDSDDYLRETKVD